MFRLDTDKMFYFSEALTPHGFLPAGTVAFLRLSIGEPAPQ